jgi:hypothetical protein
MSAAARVRALFRKQDGIEIEVSRFHHEKVFGKPPKSKCSATDELCRSKNLLSLIKKKKTLAFVAPRSKEGMQAFERFTKEKEKQDLSEEEHLHSVLLFIPQGTGAAKNDVGVNLITARILHCAIEDGMNFGVIVAAEEAKAVNV